ncbi:MAG TPA: hypothetical protein PKD90_07555 [Phnomibacter sp.]|nr:hypothetical protein [Phnomibacter sp.]
MAINKNHPFEEIDGIRCAIVETGINQERVNFLKPLLEYNGYEVLVKEAPPAKASPKPVAAPAGEAAEAVPAQPPASLYTLAVTNVMFNAVNAIFGRLLKTPNGRIVTQAYWLQKEAVADDETPYFEKRELFREG